MCRICMRFIPMPLSKIASTIHRHRNMTVTAPGFLYCLNGVLHNVIYRFGKVERIGIYKLGFWFVIAYNLNVIRNCGLFNNLVRNIAQINFFRPEIVYSLSYVKHFYKSFQISVNVCFQFVCKLVFF